MFRTQVLIRRHEKKKRFLKFSGKYGSDEQRGIPLPPNQFYPLLSAAVF